ncbi:MULTISPECIES: MFS transporter [unclassified Gemella]|uniref:MFS transporter n=1 Tax=unclassified Gemella TaxID=2624949 RepID=UPI00207B20B3|nr:MULTISPECIES: MFS transporter [unclassified Gemella]
MKNDYNAILIILVYFLLQLSHSAYNNYSVLYIESLNISKKWLTGLVVNISVISEIIFFIFSSKLVRKVEAKNLLLFSCFIASLRWFLLGIFQNVYIFALTQVTHAITFALAQLAFVLILNSKFSVDKTLDMQSLYSSICFQLSAFIGMYVVGSIWDTSTQLVFYVSSFIALMALIISFKIKFE